MSWKLHSIWISKPEEKEEWGEREGGSSAGPIKAGPSCSRSGCARPGCGAETQGTTQRKAHCWTIAQPEFKNKHFAVRIKANSAFMYITSYMVRRKRFFWLLEERERDAAFMQVGLASGRGVPSFSTGKSSIKETNLKVLAIPLNSACVLNVCIELACTWGSFRVTFFSGR